MGVDMLLGAKEIGARSVTTTTLLSHAHNKCTSAAVLLLHAVQYIGVWTQQDTRCR